MQRSISAATRALISGNSTGENFTHTKMSEIQILLMCLKIHISTDDIIQNYLKRSNYVSFCWQHITGTEDFSEETQKIQFKTTQTKRNLRNNFLKKLQQVVIGTQKWSRVLIHYTQICNQLKDGSHQTDQNQDLVSVFLITSVTIFFSSSQWIMCHVESRQQRGVRRSDASTSWKWDYTTPSLPAPN